MKKVYLFLTLSAIFLSIQQGHASPLLPILTPQPSLPRMGADASSVTVSGLSSGAFMAVQLGIAYSDKVHGVGAVAGGIYNCSLGKAENATDLCMKTPEKIDVGSYVKNVQESAHKGEIADPKNLASQKVFILNGAEDKTVRPIAGQKLAEFYQAFGALPATEFKLEMGHGFPSSLGKNACNQTQFPWVNKCNYEGAEKIFTHFYGSLNSPTSSSRSFLRPWSTTDAEGELLTFDQTEFESKSAKMLEYGHVYIPNACKLANSHCRLHVALHGCLQSPAIVQDAFTRGAGYNRWADTNKIIVLYPATTMGVGNTSGCWDWFGYTNKDFAVRKSLQMTAIMSMVERLTTAR